MNLTEQYGNLFMVVFATIWFGGAIILYVRALVLQRAYLRQFEPVDGFPLDSIPWGLPHSVNAAVWEAMWDWQFDPNLESQRRKVWVRFGWMAAWIFGFPILVFTPIVILI